MGNHSRAMVGVIAFALFLDYFLYGLLFPLMAHSHAGLKGEGHLALLYGVYAVSVLLVTPVFGYLGDRLGGRSTMLCGVALSICAIWLLGMASSLPLLLLGKFCQGAASAALWTSCLAMIAMNYVERRVEILGYAFTGGTFGSVTGPIAGGVMFGHLSDRWGRRRAIVTALALAIFTIPLWAFSTATAMLVAGAFVMQFMVQGAWGVIPAHLNELSPPAVRGTFPGFAYQLGNLFSSWNGVKSFNWKWSFRKVGVTRPSIRPINS